MSAMSKTLNIGALVGAAASIAAFLSQPAVRAFLEKWSGWNAPGGGWRVVAILFALINLKNLPFVWHIRFFRAFTYQLYLQPTAIPPHALFHPVITATRTPIMETDYNLHKSNSTYFSDMDISRTHLFTCLIRNGIKKNSRLYGKKRELDALGATEGTRGKHMIALGGVMCLFKREIKPYHKYEMWTRLLCWDRKWFYFVTHFVKPGVAKPKSFTLQPWRKGKKVEGQHVDSEMLGKAVYASALAKYVVKKGRMTVPPEQVLFDADMVPAKPEGWVYEEDMDANVDGRSGVGEEEWNWDIIEKERRRGVKFAESFAAMDGLHEVFDGGDGGAMGEFADLLF